MLRIVCCLAVLATCFGCGDSSTAPEGNGSTPATADGGTVEPAGNGGQPAEAKVALQTLSYDDIVKLIESKSGKVVVLDCWSTSCDPCMKEFPNLVRMHKEYGDKIACISLSFDYEGIGDPKDVQPQVLEFLEQQGATFDNLISSDDSDALYEKFDFGTIPAVFVYDQEGKLVKRFDEAEGGIYKAVEEQVKQLVGS